MESSDERRHRSFPDGYRRFPRHTALPDPSITQIAVRLPPISNPAYILSDDLHGRAPRGGRHQKPTDQERQGRRLGLTEMLRTGWFSSVYVKSVDTHRLKALLGARDQLVKLKRSLGNQVRGLLRPFGIKLPSRAGGKKFDEAAYLAARNDPILHAAIRALLESLASIEGQQARLEDEFDELAKRNEIAWRLMSVPGVGRITALAYMAAIENVERFRRTRDIGAYLGLTEQRYQSAETDVGMGISKQGDDGAALAILLSRFHLCSQRMLAVIPSLR
jgi:transposase